MMLRGASLSYAWSFQNFQAGWVSLWVYKIGNMWKAPWQKPAGEKLD